MSDIHPQFPLYIPSKGRHEYMMTSRYLTEMGLPHFIVVEPQEVDAYQEAIKKRRLFTTVLPLDMSYKEKYELCDNLGLSKSTGSGPARNFAWDHSIGNGHKWHWIMDDNIRGFYRFNRNMKYRIKSAAMFKSMEDFCLRYSNIVMAGPNYESFIPRKVKKAPVTFNSRIYSCILIRNDSPFRWRGRYNEDTILSIDMLKAGWCTVLFNAFLQKKMPTQQMKGGNTDSIYDAADNKQKGVKYSPTGTIAKSQMLVDVHPDVARLSWKFGRVHHHVDYRRFAFNKLKRDPSAVIPEGPNEYGLKLVAV